MTGSLPIIVVPDGLAYDDTTKKTLAVPSFVYRAVLLKVKNSYPDRMVYLAPANTFGGPVYEQDAAKEFLKDYKGTLIAVPSVGTKYIDTRGNASQLRDYLVAEGKWPLGPAVLVAATLHMPRAAMCFAKEGFQIAEKVPVSYFVPEIAGVPPRLAYYKSIVLHVIYEALAGLRDALRPARKG